MAAKKSDDLAALADRLVEELRPMRFAEPVTHVYNPLDYAREPYRAYCRKYAGGAKEVLFLGMNPGPWGMAQTGVPFGEVVMARDWLGVEAPVGKPPAEHPTRLVQGFGCHRNEVSGARLWGWARERFGTPEQFFSRFFVLNYCPLLFLASTGPRTATNVTPDKLPRAEREPLEAACDAHLTDAIKLLQPRILVGVGQFAESRLREVSAKNNWNLPIGRILHPSPASPAANRGWTGQAEAALRKLGVEL